MSTATISLSFNDFARTASEGEALQALRIALLYGEQLRIPSSSEWLRILAGKAWVSYSGEDHLLGEGEELDLPRAKGGAVISALGGESLFFEVK
ncbi:MAG TPA: hypothetical protein VFL04_03985 [Rectinemataceae bacterium]|nr:hypothetical protein [Rectinemataceae bacterium]